MAASLHAQTATPIFVELKSPEPTVVARYQAAEAGQPFDENQHRAAVRLAQDEFLQQLVAGSIPYTLTSTTLALPSGSLSVPHRYEELINAVRLEVGGWDVAKIRRIAAVKHISVDDPPRLVLDHSVPYIRANCAHPDATCSSARTMGLRGTGQINPNGSATGQVIAVLDTGIHAGVAGGHPMFDDRVGDAQFENRNFVTHPDNRPVRTAGSPFVPGVNHTKVVYRLSTDPGVPDDTGHGTMVASTAAGLKARTLPTDGSVVVEGVAPGALLMDYKVCPSLSCAGAVILLSLDDSVRPRDVLGFPKPVATVVNMSFGSTSGDPNSANGTAAGNLQFAGVFPEASAGNDGPEENTIGSPAASRRVIATAATIDPGVSPNSAEVLLDDAALRATPGSPANAGALAPRPDIPPILAVFAPESNAKLGFAQPVAQYYVNVGLGDTPDQVPPSVLGRVCLAKRGSTVDAGVSGSGLFGNKAAQCSAKGGIALVVFNNTPGQIGAVLAPSSIPVFTISGADGLTLRDTLGFESAASGAISNFPIRLNPADPALFTPDTAGFSSRGPNNDFKVVKPDITAPGTAILMGASPTGIPVLLGDPDHYNSADGTSFSGPHVAGAAALVRDAFARPNFAPSVVRAALMNGSTNLREADGTQIPDTDDNNFIHETGAGLTEMVRALSVKAVMGTNELKGTGGPDEPTDPDFLPSHSYGELGLIGTGLPANHSSQRRTITVTLADVSSTAGGYNLSIVDAGALRGDITRPINTPGFSVSLNNGSVSVRANKRATFDVTIAVDGTAAGLQVAGPDINGDPATEFLWYVIAARADDTETLRMPFYARIAEGAGVAPGEASKVTGGGWIPDGGERAKFEFNARFKSGAPAGHINYDAKESGISLKGNVQALSISGFQASFGGTCTLENGDACKYTSEVEDNAEPGKGADRFSIKVFTPAGVLLHQNDGLLGGGNIQIHRSQ